MHTFWMGTLCLKWRQGNFNPPLLHIFSQGTLQEFSTTIYHQELTEVKPLAKGCVGGWIEEGSKAWNGRTDGWMNG